MTEETSLVERIQALASELEGQIGINQNHTPQEELNSAQRMLTDLRECAAVIGMTEGLVKLLKTPNYSNAELRDQMSAIEERLQYADPEP